MVDKNGKLFGKINIIDLLIIVVVLALVVFVAMKVVDKNDETTGLTEVRISFFGEEVPDYVAAALKEGTSVLDSKENVTMGTVESFSVGAPLGYVTDNKGQIQSAVKDGYSSVSIDIIAQAQLGEHGAMVDGVLYGIGHTVTIYAGEAKIYLKISGIESIG